MPPTSHTYSSRFGLQETAAPCLMCIDLCTACKISRSGCGLSVILTAAGCQLGQQGIADVQNFGHGVQEIGEDLDVACQLCL